MPHPQLAVTRGLWLPLATAVSGVLAILPWFVPFGPVTGEPGGLLAAVMITGITGILCLLASRRPGTSSRLRQALVFLAGAVLLPSLGNFLRLVHALGVPAPTIPYLAEISEFAIWALSFLALIRVPLRPIAPENKWRVAIDIAISFLGMAIILFVIWMLPGLRNAPTAARHRIMFFNWMEAGNLFLLNLILVRGSAPELRRALGWLTAAVATDTVYLVVFQYLIGRQTFDGRILNSLFFVDVFVYFGAAWYFFRPPTVARDAPSRPAILATINPLPVCTVLGVGTLLIISVAQSPTPPVMILSAGTVLMSFLLLARVVASTRESLRLSQDKFEIEQRAQIQKMEAVGRLAGGVAHDFNNLLAVVLASSELASLGLPEGHPALRDLAEIKRTSVRGAALTGRLLALGRRQNLQPKVVSPAALLRDTVSLLQRTVGESVKLSTHAEDAAGCIRVDPHDFEQALVSLAANGRDAMPKTGGALAITVKAQTLGQPLVSDYLTAQPGRYVVITSTDNGAGMNAATRARLFEPFFTTKEHGRGSGFGLASVFGMVKSADGGIAIKSAPGQGTSIELWIPEVSGAISDAGRTLLSAAPATVAATTTTRATALGTATPADSSASATILLVEDEAGVRETTQRILEAKGYVVLAAGDAQEAREVLARPSAREVKLLLTDVIMPGQHGPALAAELVRQRPILRVLFMSGYTGDELRSPEFAQAGGQLLIKPFTGDELTSRVHQILGGS